MYFGICLCYRAQENNVQHLQRSSNLKIREHIFLRGTLNTKVIQRTHAGVSSHFRDFLWRPGPRLACTAFFSGRGSSSCLPLLFPLSHVVSGPNGWSDGAHHSGRTLTPEEERESERCFPLAQGVEAAHQGLVTHETVQPVVTAADFSSNNCVEPSKFGQIKLPVRECVFSVSYTHNPIIN